MDAQFRGITRTAPQPPRRDPDAASRVPRRDLVRQHPLEGRGEIGTKLCDIAPRVKPLHHRKPFAAGMLKLGRRVRRQDV